MKNNENSALLKIKNACQQILNLTKTQIHNILPEYDIQAIKAFKYKVLLSPSFKEGTNHDGK